MLFKTGTPTRKEFHVIGTVCPTRNRAFEQLFFIHVYSEQRAADEYAASRTATCDSTI